MHDAVDLVDRVVVRSSGREVSKTAALIDGDIDDGRPRFHRREPPPVLTSFGAAAPGIRTAPMTMSASATSSAVLPALA